MKDIVVEGYLKSFVEDFGFQDLSESEKFERFCAFSCLNKEFNFSLASNDLNDISVGTNKGIDSISFYINGELVKNKSQFESIKKASKQKLDINFFSFKQRLQKNLMIQK
jgi:hypothetical protein